MKRERGGLVPAGEILQPITGELITTPAQERLLDAAEAIRLEPATITDAVFQHAVFCQLGLPRKRTAAGKFERSIGAVSILIKAGELRQGGQWVQHPLPWGPKPRLILVYAITEALKNSSPTVSIGRTAAEFMGRIGIEPQGSEYRSVNRQLQALAACEIKLGIGYAGYERTKPMPTFDHIDLLTRNPHQQTLWTREIEFTPQFYASIREHSVPLREDAVSALRGSALALDVYAWLAHRLYRVKGRVNIRWESLKVQFGQEYASIRPFRQEFIETLRHVLLVYPEARVVPGREGLTLLSAPPPIPPKVAVSVPALPA